MTGNCFAMDAFSVVSVYSGESNSVASVDYVARLDR